MASLSYVTGSHNFKTGFSHAWGTAEQHRFNNGDIGRIRIRNGAAYEIQAGNWPWIQTFNLPWTDPNGDSIAQDEELDFSRLPANFGTRRLDDIDPELFRGVRRRRQGSAGAGG